MEHLEVLEPRAADQPDSLTSLLYALQFTTLQITLHSLAAIYFIIRLYALPFVFVYRHCAKRATSLFRLLGGTVASPLRAVRNISRLYHIVSWQTQVVGLAEVHKPSIGDAVSVESILLKRLGIQDYHESLEEVRRGDSVESPTSTSVARAGIDHVHEEPQTLVVAFKPVIQPILSAKADKPQEQNSCPECVHERSGCTICTLVTRNSSVDSHIPRRTKSDGEFRPPPPMNDEALKLPWRQLQPKKSGKLQKRMLKY